MPYLPGQIATASNQELSQHTCEGFDEGHCGKPSELKVVGETDSFGSEFHYMCRECHTKEVEHYKENPTLETCERCNQEAVVRPYRDPDEGMSGPVYWACSPCISKYMEYYREDEPVNQFADDEDDEPWTPEDQAQWEADEAELDHLRDQEDEQARQESNADAQ